MKKKKLLKHECIRITSLEEYYKAFKEYGLFRDDYDTEDRINEFLENEKNDPKYPTVVGHDGVWSFDNSVCKYTTIINPLTKSN